MSAEPLVARWTRPARIASIRDDLLVGAPGIVASVVLVHRFGGAPAALAAALLGVAILVTLAISRARRFDRRWLIAALDAAHADAEDSSDLLLADPETLTPLQRLQRRRVEARLGPEPPPELTRPRARTVPVILWVAAAIVAAAVLLWPRPRDAPLAPAREGLPVVAGVPRLVGQALRVVPPAYTGLPPRDLRVLDARVPAGSRLEWRLRFAPDPAAASLTMLDGAPLPLVRRGDAWRAGATADRPRLYRIVPAGAPPRPAPSLHRIDVVPDRPPRVRLLAPTETLNLATSGQRGWPLAFEASDDHGVAPTARLRLVLAQGDGENVRFSERLLTLSGTGTGRTRRFAARIDLAAAGFTDTGDLVAQLIVSDNRAPGPQQVHGPSVILRRPPARGAEGAGLEGMARRVMPAYFRSQRQIIIDAEALLGARRRLPADRFLSRSDALGGDQRILRLRYGQFMGEETGGGATTAMPTNDKEEKQAGHAEAPGEDHDHGPPAATPPVFGAEGDVVAEFGHTHDESEAATLLDPGTRATLRQALDAMWLSERALRQGDPRAALPHAYRALRFIKQVQQATRIFLARTGIELPPVDMARRLTGDRGEMGARGLPDAAAIPLDATPAMVWQALSDDRRGETLDRLAGWLAANRDRVPDPLALAGAIDTLRREPGCAACRDRLRGLLWAATARPVPGVTRRPAGDAVGRRYLDRLR